MPNQVIPITNLSEFGLVEDTPNVSLPPNAFSDLNNVRLRDGAVRKMPGRGDITHAGRSFSTPIRYYIYWQSPSGIQQIYVLSNMIHVYREGANNPVASLAISDRPTWQHTFFNGGFHVILNNGVDTPVYIEDGSATINELPGWASYLTQEVAMDFVYDGQPGNLEVTDPRFVPNATLRITVTPRNVGQPIVTDVLTINPLGTGFTPDGTTANLGTATISGTTITFIPAASIGGASIRISIVGSLATTVTAGVIRSYGNLLVAGNLVETNADGETRMLTGVVRTSDVAAPGNIPMNWNPFAIGVSTADEFVLAATGIIQDMVELQGVLYIYTDTSIHAIQQTQSPVVPFQISPVTDSYGADNVDAVIEVDGKHIVFGSDDVYMFSGHPGSIQSIAEGRVRQYFRSATNIKITRFNRWDELWFWSLTSPEIYIWNYRANIWYKRSVPTGFAGLSSTPNNLAFIEFDTDNTDAVYFLEDQSENITYIAGAYIERKRLALTPEFDTEELASMALLVDGGDTVTINVQGTNAPGELLPDGIMSNLKTFTIETEYKQDIRVHGRFLNYRLTHDFTSNMNLAGMQFDVKKGGTR